MQTTPLPTLAAGIVGVCWAAFIAYWLVSAFGAKRTAGGFPWRREVSLRLGVLVVIIVLVNLFRAGHVVRGFWHATIATNPIVDVAGVVLCLAGMAVAIAARISLGKNWGMPMTRKENPELVTTGPYRWVRHPIYSGFLLAMLGSAFVEGLPWLVVLAVAGTYFIYSAATEERIMAKQFPAPYAEYKKMTKMLIPFLL